MEQGDRIGFCYTPLADEVMLLPLHSVYNKSLQQYGALIVTYLLTLRHVECDVIIGITTSLLLVA